jgi:hypothetical protein
MRTQCLIFIWINSARSWSVRGDVYGLNFQLSVVVSSRLSSFGECTFKVISLHQRSFSYYCVCVCVCVSKYGDPVGGRKEAVINVKSASAFRNSWIHFHFLLHSFPGPWTRLLGRSQLLSHAGLI